MEEHKDNLFQQLYVFKNFAYQS
jgi:hypothetical protein